MIQQYVLSTLPGMLAEMQSMVLPMRSFAVTWGQKMIKIRKENYQIDEERGT